MAANRKKKKKFRYFISTLLIIFMLTAIGFVGLIYLQMIELDKAIVSVTVDLKDLQQQVDDIKVEKSEKQDKDLLELEKELEETLEDTTTQVEEKQTEEEQETIVSKTDETLLEKTSSEEEEESEEEESQAKHKVYLTFDDGPGENTIDILDILDQYNVKATFFVVGTEASKFPELVQEIVDRGHTLAMHSYSHKYSQIYQSLDAFAEDFKKVQDYLYEITGETSMIYRFPGGSSNTVSKLDMHLFADYLAEEGVEYFDWNISSGDGGSVILDVQTILQNCTQNQGITKRETSVILMHDVGRKTTTVEALPQVIETIQEMEDTAILPITKNTEAIHHIQ